MIARIWRGWAPPATADEYQRHYASEVAGHLSQVPGFRGARLLRSPDGDLVLFTSITYFEDMSAVRSFAGVSFDRAVVEEAARRVLTRWDEHVTHHEVVVNLGLAGPEPV
ncbi:antibiotic biosynthesis monooxygenase [Dactylosporangium sp. NPDC005572]|uniref:antibiotic biosynthesis monooxygenase family protein n=1 Tax=Dactylosporangium sp. NPDC005572 TaxID=3156889 RepID=UPI00339E94FC